MTQYSHLQPAYRQYADLTAEERIAWIRADRWLETANAQLALTRLNDLITYPPRDRMPCLLIYGDTGMGKTKIIRKFLRDHAPTFDQHNDLSSQAWSSVVKSEPSRPSCMRPSGTFGEGRGSRRRKNPPPRPRMKALG